jgi:hypothetical protein
MRSGVAVESPSTATATVANVQRLRDDFYKWPEPLRFFISGNVGNLVFFVLEHLGSFNFERQS